MADAPDRPDHVDPVDPVDPIDPVDATKARYQEALARKQQRHHGSAPGDPSEHGKPHHAAGPAGQKREFRRKSG
jgi:hypothetical protein